MTYTLLTTGLVAFMFFQAVRALVASLSKERTMVKEGGIPLPTSVWVYLMIEVFLAPLTLYTYMILMAPVFLWNSMALWWVVILIGVGYFIAVQFSRFISAIVATIVRYRMVKQYNKQIEGNTNQEVANQLKEQLFGK